MKIILDNDDYIVKNGVVTGKNERRAQQLSMWLLTNSQTSVVQYNRDYLDALQIAREFHGTIVLDLPEPPPSTLMI